MLNETPNSALETVQRAGESGGLSTRGSSLKLRPGVEKCPVPFWDGYANETALRALLLQEINTAGSQVAFANKIGASNALISKTIAGKMPIGAVIANGLGYTAHTVFRKIRG